MTPRRKSTFLRSLFLLPLMLLCLAGIAFFVLIEWLPSTASREIGPAASGLDPFQRIYYSARLLNQKDGLLTPVDPSGKARTFQIESGESVNLIALHLEESGLIRDAALFRMYLVYSGKDTDLQSGDFQLSPASNAIQIAQTLRDINAREVVFRILPGWRVEEVAAGLAVSGLNIKEDDFIKLANQPPAGVLPSGLSDLKKVEGFLLPGSYRFLRSASSVDVITEATRQFDLQVTGDIRVAMKRQGLTLQQGVALASIVQREALVAEEQPIIASVFYNRLKNGMKLESDPTVQYSIGYNAAQKTWWTNPLSLKDLKFESPYNTYSKLGLPPGPIASPGLSALRAVAYPAETPYLYFRAKCDGSGQHLFSVTFDEHLQNGCP
jgi:UPF0755 protein